MRATIKPYAEPDLAIVNEIDGLKQQAMKNFTKKLPVIIDLQPEPQDVVLRLPEWMKYLFILLYMAT